jgi:hypothetical protein
VSDFDAAMAASQRKIVAVFGIPGPHIERRLPESPRVVWARRLRELGYFGPTSELDRRSYAAALGVCERPTRRGLDHGLRHPHLCGAAA